MSLIKVQNLTKQYPDGETALKDVSLEVKSGEGIVLLGANGSGKSTFLRCLVGLEKATSGKILIDNQDIVSSSKKQLQEIRKKIGVVFQKFNLVNNLSAFQNVLFGNLGQSNKGFWSSLNLTASSEEREKAMECLARVSMAEFADRRTDTLSGGQRQRVAIARMLMQDPEIVLADEPVASLDPRAGREVMNLLWEIIEEKGLTVMCILHQLDFALEYGERLVGLQKGSLTLDRSAANINKKELNWLYEAEKVVKNYA
ncbi:phosphonate ABC transporter ATP-binding protein [Natroniella acetigena]|uniref:phosphonate ABC transporter ATP-binding protein n=1 Tax=Natroniella acetigena TaxID=52004 RepID=UPI00200A4501|nr:phosphonate ABC transporter ATP-binding protein [Natroniella acetigena]MCK8826523.1 phosphonate ABC transporter ATP-binding protein [Natroniella acetigena]